MDLITAKVEASKLSLDKKQKVYINRDKDGECLVELAPAKNPDNIIEIYVAGSQVKDLKTEIENLSTFEEKIENKKMETVKKAAPAKKVAKSTTPKKIAAKKSPAPKKPAAKVVEKSKDKKIIRGNNMALTEAEWKKVDGILNKEDISFSSWSKSLVLAKIK